MANYKAASGAIRMWQLQHLQLNRVPSPILSSSILIGRVLPGRTPYEQASGFRPGDLGLKERNIEVRVPYNVYDKHFHSFFPHEWDFAVIDEDSIANEGDLVLIRRDKKKPAKSISLREMGEAAWWEPKIEEKTIFKIKDITHKIVDVIHKLGDTIEATTGKPVVADRYRDEMDKLAQLYGQSDSDFDYKNAPKRGWQRGKRDFSDRRTYKRWHNFKVKDPYSIIS